MTDTTPKKTESSSSDKDDKFSWKPEDIRWDDSETQKRWETIQKNPSSTSDTSKNDKEKPKKS